MRRFKNLVIGGIQSKVFNLILLTIILMSVTFTLVSSHQSAMLKSLSAESNSRQQESIRDISDTVMEQVIDTTIARTTELEAYIANELFHGMEKRVSLLGEYAELLFTDPESSPRADFAGPDPSRHGEVTAQMILADGVNGSEPVLADRMALAANMSGLMISLFGASEETNSCFIALPDGVFLVVDDRSGNKFDMSGNAVSYDPRTRPWYQLAVEKGGLIFTDVETDAFTGDIGIVCAMPIYVNGSLAAVVGSDLFLTSMQEVVQASDVNGEFICVINQKGHTVFSPKTEGTFAVLPSTEAADLRQSDNGELSALLKDAAKQRTEVRLIDLPEGKTYIAGAPMETIGWVLLNACSYEISRQPTVFMQENYERIQQETVETYQASTKKIANQSTWIGLGVSTMMLAGALLLSKRIVRPLDTVTKRISELSESNMEFKMEDVYRTGDEIEELAQSFANISHRTVGYLQTVKEVTAEKERISTELSMATRIQSAMLPHIFPPFPGRNEFDIFASMDPAKEVGGDFYDYFLIDDDHLGMVIADVSGKGVPGALFMMASKIILQSVAMLGYAPAEILSKTNDAICSNNDAQMFVTVWLGIMEISTGQVVASNAGHEYPVLKHPGEKFELIKDKHGFVIGGMDGIRYTQYEFQMQPGSRLFVYTDGVAEATNANEELFGTDRMLEALNSQPDASPREMLANVRKAVDDFVQDAEQFDDLTMLAIEYKGKGQKEGGRG